MNSRNRTSAVRATWILLITGLVAGSCGGTETDVVTRETDEGLVVTNLGSMEVAPEGTLQLQWRYQSDEWVDPSDVEMEGTDLVAIADPGAGRVYTIASQGDQVRGWGRLGDGPGEWQGVSGMVLHAGEVLVQPTSAPYVERFDAGGERMGRLEVGEPVTLVGSSDSLLIASSRSGPGRVIMIDPRQGTILNEVRTAPIERYPLDRYGSCWRLAAAQDRVYRLNCSAGRIEVLDPSGSRTALFEMADEPRASTEEELDAYIERFWESQSDGRPLDPIIRRQLDHVREGAAIFPKYTAIRADPRSGRMILVEQPFGDHGSDDATLHIVSPDGHHMSRIHTQSRIRDLAFVGDTIAMLVRDPATGLAELQLHLLQLEPR